MTSTTARKHSFLRRVLGCWQLYVMLLPPVVYVIVFLYWPLYGLQIAFKNFSVAKGIGGSPWVGWKYFETFVNSYQFWPLIKNTLILNVYELLALFPLPIVLALALNTVRSKLYSRGIQLITYAPHFISTVIVVGIMVMMLDPSVGVVNQLLVFLGGSPVDFLGNSDYFRHVYVWSGAWQTLGYSAIIYLAALAGIDPQLHEAAKVDGASILRRVWHIDLPGVLPVTITLLILNLGSILSSGFEKVLLLQNNLNLGVSQVIDTYVYQVGLQSSIPQFSYAAAVGLFKSVIALILVLLANWLARRVAKQSLF
ncbi:ABC transporter permease [Kribbella italica]|uniref:Multiple sugar transport system permease protein/putative aldouronate transport system permease protein n=1 Tax=Kribbella italica TaxID=1540520 RepID=A0A7W9J5J7_9ACTN|nr:multiple sugar transport system permease protein/putative aldouronate transport system permease protein [Kribbella italica]